MIQTREDTLRRGQESGWIERMDDNKTSEFLFPGISYRFPIRIPNWFKILKIKRIFCYLFILVFQAGLLAQPKLLKFKNWMNHSRIWWFQLSNSYLTRLVPIIGTKSSSSNDGEMDVLEHCLTVATCSNVSDIIYNIDRRMSNFWNNVLTDRQSIRE